MSLRQVRLPEGLDRFIAAQVESGRYTDENEALIAAVRALETESQSEQEKLERLRGAAAVGFDQLDRGLGVVIEGEDQLREHIAELGRRAAERHGICFCFAS